MTMDEEVRLTNHEIDLIHGEASVGWLTIGDMNEVPNRLWITDHELIGQAVQTVLAKRVAQAYAEAYAEVERLVGMQGFRFSTREDHAEALSIIRSRPRPATTIPEPDCLCVIPAPSKTDLMRCTACSHRMNDSRIQPATPSEWGES